MTTIFILLGSAVALELLVHLFGSVQRLRKVLAATALFVGGLAAGGLVVTQLNLFSALVAVLSLYRMLNMMRVMQERMHERYLRRSTRRTSLILIVVQVVVLIGWAAWNAWHSTGHTTWAVIGVMQTIVAGLLLASVIRSLKKTAWPVGQEQRYSDHELPTVTVAIPARNETEDLQQCLQSVVASDYPKLEIIVLDDCSQTKRTPEIIKDFAQDGVRFIQGQEPSATWLPKNQAYDRLAREASGEYILFAGVDIRFAPDSVRQVISTMLARRKQMVSILPRRQPEAYGHLSLIQAMRYWWELVPPRRYFRRPPVLSSCWVIQRGGLKKAGGFRSVARAIVPEARFARELIASDGYSFLRSSQALGIESNKRVQDQRDTAIRMRYPQVHRRPEQAFFASLFEVVFLLLPFVLAVAGFWVSIGPVAHIEAILASILLSATYELTVLSTHTNNWLFGLVGQPFAVLTDVALMHYSMWKYEFSAVHWKGRNICIPAMHVVPHLPKVQ